MSRIDEFRQQLTNGGHRANRYRVQVTFPNRTTENAPKAQSSFEFLCFSTSIPVQAIGEIPVKYKGRTIYLAGDMAEPEAWTCTVYNTTSFDIRNACITWKNNFIAPDSVTGEDLMDTSTVDIEMLGKDDSVLQRATLYNAWPNSIGAVTLAYTEENSISTFELQLRYDWIDELPVSGGNSETTIEG